MIRVMKYGEVPASEIFARVVPEASVGDTVSAILADVRSRGDAAIFAYGEQFDGAKLTALAVGEKELAAAMEKVEPDFLRVLRRAAENIRRFHEKQTRTGFVLSEEPGIVMGQRVLPLDRVGIYVPGGTAAYPSTVLMDAIPAKIAGCGEIVMTTPPRRDGSITPEILAAAQIAGVDCVFKIGGAQAIAALAYGTESVPRVDKIVGPGNAFVAEAKRQVYGCAAIDMIAGPSEILIVADGKSDARCLAADLLSQAEHDRLASAVLITDSEQLARAVQAELESQLKMLPREEIARVSIEQNGKIILADSLLQAIDIANEIAPEHLELCLDQPFDWLGAVRHAGSVFLGRHCPEALGDYLAGANHTLPTSGAARFSSPLSVDDFVKKMQYTYYSADALRDAAPDIARFARREGLDGHARSAEIRFEEEEA